MPADVLVVAPFRRPTFRKAISADYPTEEPWDSAPLAVAGALVSAGLAVRYLALQNLLDGFDADADLARLVRLLESEPARIVLFASDGYVASRSTATLPGVRAVARALASRSGRPYVGMTGRLATTAQAQLFDLVDELDFLVVGEPELAVVDAARALLDNGLDAMAATSPAVLTRETATRAARPGHVSSLDAPALPAFDLLARSLDEASSNRVHDLGPVPLSVRTSVGCQFRCRFCAGVPFWRQYRTKSAGRVAAELDALLGAVGDRARVAFLEDEVFTLDPGHVASVAHDLRSRSIVLDGVYTHSSMLTPEVAAELATVTRAVFLGFDAATDEAMRAMRKGQTIDTAFAAIDVARGAGLGVHLEWLLGSPEDDVDTVITALNTIYNLLMTGAVRTVNTYVYCPHPGTEYAESATAHAIAVVDGFDEMQESGGYPAADVAGLTRPQVFTAYLMSQIVIGEALRTRAAIGPARAVRGPNRAELRALFDRMATG